MSLPRRSLVACVVALALAGGISYEVVTRLFARRSVAAATTSVPAPRPATPRGRALIVVIDGLRADVAFAQLPIAGELARRGASGVALADDPTMTGAGVRTLGTGVPPELADLLRNDSLEPVPPPHLLSALIASGHIVAVTGDHSWTDLFGAFVAIDQTRADLPPIIAAMRPIDAPDRAFFDKARSVLVDRRATVSIVHLSGADAASHTFGPHSRPYAEHLRVLDTYIRALVAACGDDCDVVLTSDHGANDEGHHGLAEPIARETPLVLAGHGIAVGVRLTAQQIDIAPTLAVLLGAEVPATAHGRVLVEALAIDACARARLAIDDAHRLARLAGRAIDGMPLSLDDTDACDRARATADASRRAAADAIRRSERGTDMLWPWIAALAIAAVVLLRPWRYRWTLGDLIVLAACAIAIELAWVAWRTHAELLRREVLTWCFAHGRTARACNIGGTAAVMAVLWLALRLPRTRSLSIAGALALAAIGDYALPWVAIALLIVTCQPLRAVRALRERRVARDLAALGWAHAPLVLTVAATLLRVLAPESLAMSGLLVVTVAALGFACMRGTEIGWSAVPLLVALCEPAKLPGLAVLLLLVAAAAHTSRSPARLAAIVLAARIAMVFLVQHQLTYSDIPWDVGTIGNPGYNLHLAHGLVVLSIALPAGALLGIATSHLEAPELHAVCAWCLALLLLHLAHTLASLAITIGQTRTPYLDVSESLYTAAYVASFAIAAPILTWARQHARR